MELIHGFSVFLFGEKGNYEETSIGCEAEAMPAPCGEQGRASRRTSGDIVTPDETIMGDNT